MGPEPPKSTPCPMRPGISPLIARSGSADPAQWGRAGPPAGIRTAAGTAAAALVGWFCSAVAIGEGFRCLADRWGRADVRFCFLCLADLLDTVGLRSGAVVALSDRPRRSLNSLLRRLPGTGLVPVPCRFGGPSQRHGRRAGQLTVIPAASCH